MQVIAQRRRLQRRQGYRIGPEIPSFPQPWMPQRSQLFGIGGDFDRLPGVPGMPGVPGLLRGGPFAGPAGSGSRGGQPFRLS